MATEYRKENGIPQPLKLSRRPRWANPRSIERLVFFRAESQRRGANGRRQRRRRCPTPRAASIAAVPRLSCPAHCCSDGEHRRRQRRRQHHRQASSSQQHCTGGGPELSRSSNGHHATPGDRSRQLVAPKPPTGLRFDAAHGHTTNNERIVKRGLLRCRPNDVRKVLRQEGTVAGILP